MIRAVYKSLGFFVCIAFLISCNPQKSQDIQSISSDNNEEQSQNPIINPEEEGRIVWQKPEKVIELLGDLSDKTVADIGAGTGYFTFRFALKAKKVIAIDIDPKMIQILESFKMKLPVEIQERIEARLALPNDPKLEPGEADVVVIINTIGYIKNRKLYLNNLKKGLSENGEIMILDFKTKNIPITAPPMEYRIPLATLETELISDGYQILSSDDRTLDYQYILRARKQ